MKKLIFLFIVSCTLLRGMQETGQFLDAAGATLHTHEETILRTEKPVLGQIIKVSFAHEYIGYHPNQLESFLAQVKDRVEQINRQHPDKELCLDLSGNLFHYRGNATLKKEQQEQLLSNFFSQLKKYRIAQLSLYRNILRTVPETIASLCSLKKLDLSYNHLTSLPKAFSQIPSLQELDLSYNWLLRLPQEINRTTHLKINIGAQILKSRSGYIKDIYTLRTISTRLLLNPNITLQMSPYQLGIAHKNIIFKPGDEKHKYVQRFNKELHTLLQQYPQFKRDDIKINEPNPNMTYKDYLIY